MKKLIIASIFTWGIIPLSTTIVLAQSSGCYYNGQLYPIGTTIGNYECTPEGWQRIQ